MMKLFYSSTSITFALACFTSNADARSFGGLSRSPLAFALSTSVDVKKSLKRTCEDIQAKSPTGVFITVPDDRKQLLKAVAELEAVSGLPSADVEMVGDWTLLCTTATVPNLDKNAKGTMLPFDLPSNPFQEIQDSLQNAVRRSFKVVQKIRSKESNGVVDRVDNVIQYMPPNTFKDVFGDVFPQLGDTKINPLNVSETDVALIHKAEVQSTTPVYRTKISLESVVLTVAGTSKNLKPEGADILGVNVPLGEFLNAGYFDTTYIDDTMRISRSKIGPVEYCRVFERQSTLIKDAEIVEPAAEQNEQEIEKVTSADTSEVSQAEVVIEDVAAEDANEGEEEVETISKNDATEVYQPEATIEDSSEEDDEDIDEDSEKGDLSLD